jgi:hypothetical protein
VNDFATKVRPAFDFLSDVNGYRLAHEGISSSFDNGVLIYESDHLRVAVVRDRGQVSFTVRGRSDYRDVDEEIVRCLLANAKHYSKAEDVPDSRWLPQPHFFGRISLRSNAYSQVHRWRARSVGLKSCRPNGQTHCLDPLTVGSGIRVLPNTRVKLSAPFFCEGHPFVNIRTSRRSLGAFR